MTPRELAREAFPDLFSEAEEVLGKSIAQNVAAFQEAGADVLRVYEAAEVCREVFTKAYQLAHRLTAVASCMRIEDVG
ncbi:MAG: hypothetical protein ACTHJ3_00720 [Pararhizobium sp.]